MTDEERRKEFNAIKGSTVSYRHIDPADLRTDILKSALAEAKKEAARPARKKEMLNREH